MFQMNENDIVGKTMDQQYKENYIADMLVRTLYSNDECYNIVKLFKEKVLEVLLFKNQNCNYYSATAQSSL